jgi:hypothetical protein
MALVVATRAKHDPNLRSLSQIRYFGACPYGVASRSCCATQGSVGNRVTPTWITRRDLSWMMKNAKSGRKKRSVTGKRVASPDLCGVIVHKGCPPLSPWLRSTNSPHIFLDGALAHMNTQFQQFPTNPLSAPEPILLRHLSDQRDGFRGYLGLV